MIGGSRLLWLLGSLGHICTTGRTGSAVVDFFAFLDAPASVVVALDWFSNDLDESLFFSSLCPSLPYQLPAFQGLSSWVILVGTLSAACYCQRDLLRTWMALFNVTDRTQLGNSNVRSHFADPPFPHTPLEFYNFPTPRTIFFPGYCFLCRCRLLEVENCFGHIRQQ